MLLINPYWIEDVGFQLSFMATLGLILFETKVSNKLKILPSFVRSGFSTSFSAQLGVAPILLLAFGFISMVGLVVNPLVLWTVPYITIGGMISGALGVIYEPLGRLGVYLIYPLTSWFIFVVNLFS
jgi:competence protein ComEC